MTGAILAGGRSRRMGGHNKALALLAGKPLLAYVIERLAPQVSELCLSVERFEPELGRFTLPQVPDPAEGSNGPLGGLLATLAGLAAHRDWVLLAPCDAPFLPDDLAVRLLASAIGSGRPGAVARYRDQLQPTFSLWHRDLLPRLRRAVLEDGMGGFKQFLERHPLPAVDWPEAGVDPFFNVNTPADLERARALVEPPGARML